MSSWSDSKSRDRFFKDLHTLEIDEKKSETEDEDVQVVLSVFKRSNSDPSKASNTSAYTLSGSKSKNEVLGSITSETVGKSLKNSMSDSNLLAKSSSRLSRSGTKRKAQAETVPPTLKSYDSTTSATDMGSKRLKTEERSSSSKFHVKKATKLPVIADEDQVFRGLNFFFLPNDNIKPQRRMRIEKVQQYGGTWVRECIIGKTDYVVLERDLKSVDLLKWMKWDSYPDSIYVVDESFIGACISGKILLDARCGFCVTGTENDLQESPKVKLKTIQPREKVFLKERPSSPVREVNCSESEDRLDEDPLETLISEAKLLAHLPLDNLDDEVSVAEGEDIDVDSRPKLSGRINQNTFQCMHRNRDDSKNQRSNPNSRTIEIFEEMGRYYDRVNDSWRTLAYRKAVNALKKTKTKVSTREEALKITGIGDRIAIKIEEIVTTNNLRRLESTKDDPTDQALQLFMGIYGVGYSRAVRWVNSGYRTLEDLSKTDLTENQKIGIEHYEPFNSRIPRSEVEQHGAFVRDTLRAIDPQYEVTIMGSYRRGAKTSGDIDLMITKPGGSASDVRATVVQTLIPRLFKVGFLKAGLATTNNKSGSKWHGASALLGSLTWRRIDFLLVPWDERGAALIYFTGNDIFNRSIRLLASKKHMRLNQRGLYKDVMRGRGRVKVTEGELVESSSEMKIFEILGVPWRPPQERNC